MKLQAILQVIACVEVAFGLERNMPGVSGIGDRMLAALSPADREIAGQYIAIKNRAIDQATTRIQAASRP